MTILFWIYNMLYKKTKNKTLKEVHSYDQHQEQHDVHILGTTQRKDHEKLLKVKQFMMSDALLRAIDY